MSEVIEQSVIRKLALDDAHKRLHAQIQERDGWSVPANYGDWTGEYGAVRDGSGAGLIDLSSRGRIEVSGAEAVQFLNGLITNDVKTLADGAWMIAAFPNAQGRLLASVRVIRHGDSFLFDTEAVTHERVFKTLERFTLAGDFRVRDVTDETVLISVQGARAAEIVRAVIGERSESLKQEGRAAITIDYWGSSPLIVLHATHTSEDGFDFVVGASDAVSLWDALLQSGARPVGFDTLEVLRIEAGVPRYSVDVSDANVVLEAALDEAVSFMKGCYIGQEIIARIHWRGHVAKRLAGISFDEGVGPAAREAKIRSIDDREIGRVTSSVFSPRLNRVIALGMVKYDFLAPGTQVKVVSEDASLAAHVVEVPFVRGSWYKESEGAEA